VLVAAVVLGMSPWFSATVVAGAMSREWSAAPARGLWLTLGVQFGFVVGSLICAALLLPDRLRPRRLAAWSATLAAVATALLVVPGVGPRTAILLRIVVGVALAGVYPPGIKIAAGWTRDRRGLAIAALVAGTTLGSATPHLLRLSLPADAWRGLQLLAAVCAAVAALLFAARVQEGPFQAPSAPFDSRALRQVAGNRGVVLATGGYLGHMWELYAMWSSIGLFWAFVVAERELGTWIGPASAFATVSAGVAGCLWAGWAADRMGRSVVTIIAMAVSGACSVLIGLALHAPFGLLLFLGLLWGASIVADSAQFSAAVTEFAHHDYVGTAVTVQTALGFLLTMVTIVLVPSWVEAWGWRYAYMPLAIGPALGIVAMTQLRGMERARRMGADAG
jgi:MFS family permease